MSVNFKPRTLTDFFKEDVNFENLILENEVLTEENYLRLGMIAYSFGIDTFMKDLDSKQVQLISSRFNEFGITEDLFNQFCRYAKTISDEMVLKISKDFIERLHQPLEKELSVEIRNYIDKIIKSGIYPVTLSKTINEIFIEPKVKTTYEHIIFLNKLIFEDVKFEISKVSEHIKELYVNDDFTNTLAEATHRLDLKKNIYPINECILVFITHLKKENNVVDKFISVFHNPSLLETPTEEAKVVELKPTKTPTETSETTESETSEIQPKNEENPFKNPVVTYQTIFSNINEQRKLMTLEALDVFNNVSDLEQAILHMFDEEENISAFYMFNLKVYELINTYKNKGETEFIDFYSQELNNLFGGDVKKYAEELLDKLIVPRQEKYNSIINEFVEELNLDKQNEINQIVNQMLKTLIVSDKDDKALILSQLSENVIFTLKHLAQIIEVINNQEISGENIISYIKNETELDKALAGKLESIYLNTEVLEKLSLEIKVFTSVFNVLKLAY